MAETDSGSQFSRQSSTSQIHQKRGDLRAAFPLLAVLEHAWPEKFSIISFLSEFFQQLCLIIGSHTQNSVLSDWMWGSVLSAVGIPMYFTILPLWDSSYYLHIPGYYDLSIIAWTIIGILLALMIHIAFLGYSVTEQLERHGIFVAKIALHAFSSWLFLPSLHMLLTFTVCAPDQRVLYSFPEVSCWDRTKSTPQIVLFSFSVFGLAMLLLIKFISVFFLFDDLQFSVRLKARSQNACEGALALYQIISAVLYHFMIVSFPSSKLHNPKSFAALMAIGAFTVALLHVAFLPFFTQKVNQYRVVTLCLVAYASMVKVLLLHYPMHPAANFQEKNWDFLIIAGGSPFVVISALFLANLRVNKHAIIALERAARGEPGPGYGVFPHYLPKKERGKYSDIESTILAEALHAQTQQVDKAKSSTGEEEKQDCLWVGQPFVSSIYTMWDVEVSTRIVPFFQQISGLRPPVPMVAFCSKIYSKGLARFMYHPWLELQFASFLSCVVPSKNHMAMSICEKLGNRLDIDLILAYRVNKRLTLLTQALSLRDNVRRKSFGIAQGMHKEALLNIQRFWTKLLADQVDVFQLAMLAKIITDRREEGLRHYERVVSETKDPQVLVKYAQFMEQVMMDSDGAMTIREGIIEQLEQEQLGTAKETIIKQNNTGIQKSNSVTTINRSRTVSLLNFNVNLIFTSLLLLSAGLYIFAVLLQNSQLAEVDRVEKAGLARTLSQELAVVTSQLMRETNPINQQMLIQQFKNDLMSLRDAHFTLSLGNLQSTSSQVLQVFSLPKWELRLFGISQHEAVGLFTLGNNLISNLETVVASPLPISLEVGAPVIQAAFTAALAYNSSLVAYVDAAVIRMSQFEFVMIAVFILSLVIIFIVYVVLSVNFKKIGAGKLSTLGLFTLIPKNALEKLQKDSQKKFEAFDDVDAELEKLKKAHGIEDDVDAMKEILADSENENAATAQLAAAPAKTAQQTASPTGEHDMDDEYGFAPKFAAMLNKSSVADTGKLKLLHKNNFEQAYTKSSFDAPTEEVSKERLKEIDELQVDEDLRALNKDHQQKNALGTSHDAKKKTSNTYGEDNEFPKSGGNTQSDDAAKEAESSSIFNYATLIFLLLIAVTAVLGGLSLKSIFLGQSLLDLSSSAEASVTHTIEENRLRREIYLSVFEFVSTGSRSAKERVDAAFSLMKSSQHMEKLLVETGSTIHIDALKRLFLSNDAAAQYFLQARVAVHLACLGYTLGNASTWVVPPPICSENDMQWSDMDFVDPLAKTTLESSLAPRGSAIDLILPADHQLRIAKHIINLPYHHELFNVALDGPSLMGSVLFNSKTELISSQAISYLDFVDAQTAFASLFFVAVIVWKTYQIKGGSVGSSVNTVLYLSLFTSSVLLGLCVAGSRLRWTEFEAQFTQPLVTRTALNDTMSLSQAGTIRAARVAIFGHAESALTFNDLYQSSAVESSWNRFGQLLSYSDEQFFTEQTEFEAAQNCMQGLRLLLNFDRIAASLGCSSWGIAEPVALSVSTWNFSSEVYWRRMVLKYPTQRFYSTRAFDLIQLNQSEKVSLASALLFGDVHHSTERATAESCFPFLEDDTREKKAQTADRYSKERNRLIAVSVFAFISLSVFIGTFATILQGALEKANNNTRLGGNGSRGSQVGTDNSVGRKDALFEKLTTQSIIALTVLALLFSAIFIFTLVDVSITMKIPAQLNTGSQREFSLARSLLYAQLSVNDSSFRRMPFTVSQDLTLSSNYFYFGEDMSAAGYEMAGRYPQVDQHIFGSTVLQNLRFQCPSLGATKKLPSNGSIATLLDVGIDPAQQRWIEDISSILTFSKQDTIVTRVRTLESVLPLFVARLRDNSAEFTQTQREKLSQLHIGFLVIISVTLLVVLYEYVAVFRPMIWQLLNEEEGTKMMLKMIPPEVRDSVPAIAEYLETGLVLQDLKMHEINEAAVELSTIPTISINFKGTILRFSRAAEDAFGWTKSDVLGKNIKMLMPENIAVHHDGFLAKYRRTGVRHIIGKLRKVRALRKDGVLFPAEISVREIRNGRNTVFVGTVRNISVEVEFERVISLSKAVSEAATVPIVVINSKGVIQRFNAAAEETFRCTSQEVLGKKVNLLMRQQEAEVHDSFLETYMRTRKKNIIDSSRRALAKRLSGELFPVRITIREQQRGHDSLFVGYIEDVTKQVHLQMASMVSDAIAATAPYPLVAIDESGIILSWSPAANMVFGVAGTEAVGRNIRIIMPENVASRHDSYLQAYLKTGRKKMIGNVTLQKARRREEDGSYTIFPVRIAITDIIQQGKIAKFVAYIQDVSRQQELELEERLSRNVESLSAIPIISIEQDGRIRTFSQAATQVFGYTSEEAIGNNITLIIPPEIAKEHDSYLQRYLTTRIKTVIDRYRTLEGITKSGTRIPVQLMVREVVHNKKSIFIGEIRDITNDCQAAEVNTYADAISQLSTTPVVIVNQRGIIQSCSESTCEAFLWSKDELIGQNITVLMSETFAVKHDGYLARYVASIRDHGVEETRKRSQILFQERRGIARTRDERTFPVAVQVRDIHVDGAEPILVGYIRNISDELQQLGQRAIASAIVQLSVIPLICISRLGIVTEFSLAAEKDFGYTKKEILGQNLKLLMPDDVAVKHDGYLRAYAKTGIKTVLDSKRQVLAKKKNGQLFNVEIMVKEVVQKDALGNNVVEYIGFVKDMTQQYILLQANTINDVVMQLSTVPIVLSDSRGRVLDFNTAASEVFGYEPNEVINQNVKMLMTDAIADKHDEYLQRYRATKQKKIIDSTRKAQAKKKNGTVFSVEISVREVVKEGAETQYIAYLRDVSLSERIASQSAINLTIINLSPAPVIIMDYVGTVSIFSRSAEDVFGFTKAEVEGKNIKMLMPQDIAEKHDEFLRRYAETGVTNIINSTRRVRGKKKSGATFPAEVSVRELRSEGTVTFIGYVQDVSEDVFEEAQTMFADCVSSLSPVPILAINTKGILTRFSPAAEVLLGYKSTAVVGQNVKVIQPEEVAERHDFYLERYLSTGIKRVIDSDRKVQAKCFDGSIREVLLTVREVRDEKARQAQSYIGYMKDLTLDLAIEEASREGTATIDLCPIPIFVISIRGIITRVNRAVTPVFGYDPSELMDQNIKILMTPDIATQHDGYLHKYRETREKHVLDSTRLVPAKRKNDSVFQAEIRVSEICVQGSDSCYIGCIQDVTETLKMEQNALLNEAITSLSGTPLLVIDPYGIIKKFSSSATEVFGYTQNEILGKNCTILMPPNVASLHDQFLESYRRSRKKVIIGSTRIIAARKKNGSTFACEIGVREVLNEDKLTTNVFVGYIRSLEDQEVNVHESTEVNGMMMDFATQAIIIISKFGIIERVNAATKELFNVPSTIELIGQNVKMLMPDSVAAQHDGYLEAYTRTRIKKIIDQHRQTKAREVGTGRQFPIEISVREIIEADKEVRYLGCVRSIEKEVELEQIRKFNAATKDLSNYATICIDAKGTMLEFSRAAEELFELTSKEAVGKNVKILMTGDIAARHDEYLATYLRTREKHVIDSTRSLKGKGFRTGKLIDLNLIVRELKFSIQGLENVYVGYITRRKE